MNTIILLGRQGCGKGTQATMLVKEFGYHYIGSGDLLRAFFNGSGFSATKSKIIINQGGYVPTPIIFRLWMDKLEALKDLGKEEGILFDGSPRKILEASLLDQALAWYGWDENLKVILIDISRQEAENRLMKRRICQNCGKAIPGIGDYKEITKCNHCGGPLATRADDTPEGIKSRLDLFEIETVPVIEQYKKANKLIVVNGAQSIDDVYKELTSHLS